MRRREIGRATFAFGVGLVLARSVAGSLLLAAPELPGDTAEQLRTDSHEAEVLSLSAPAAGLQRAVVELRPPDSSDRVYVTLPRYPSVVPTDIIRFKAQLEAAPTDAGFGEFLARSGIAFTARPRAMERLGRDGSPLSALEQIRRGAAAAIAAGLPEPQAGLASAMSIGLRDLVARDVADDFRIGGLSHVVAISGWHIAMLGAVVSGMLGRLSRRKRSILVLASICAYTILAGASPSVLRAAVMASVVLLARESGRRGAAAPALALTVAGMLVLDPATITDVGFQLSAVATAGLLVWASPLRGWLAARLPKRTPGWLLEALGVSLAAQAATLPLVLYQFGSLSLVAPLANLLIAPLVAPAMLLTAVAFACGLLIGGGVPAVVLAPLTLVGSMGIGAMIEIAHFSASLPFATLTLPEPLNLLAAGIAAAPLLAILWRRHANGQTHVMPDATSALLGRLTAHADDAIPLPQSDLRPRLGAAALAGLAVLLVVVNGARPDGRLHLNVLDVGQGDAILLEGPSGGRMLVDTGPDPDRLVAVLDQRIPVWDRRLDVVVVTHPHEDHIAGLALLLDRYRVGEVFEPGMVGPGPGDAAYRRRMSELGRESHLLAAGDSVWLDGIRLAVDWPLPGRVPIRPADGGTAINNVSVVLDIRFGARRMLLAGDVEQQIDPQLLAAGLEAPGAPPLDVLKVAHHGSGTATTDAFLEQLRPRVAIISAGWGNPYGHPSPKTVARLVDGGARLFRTDTDGTVDVSTDGSDLVAFAEGGRPHPSTPGPPEPPTAPGIGFCPIDTVARARRRRTYNRNDVDPNADGGGPNPARPRDG